MQRGRWSRVYDSALEQELCDRLREIRLRNEIGQRATADALGVSKVALYLWERGGNFPATFSRWQQWAKAVGARIDITISEIER